MRKRAVPVNRPPVFEMYAGVIRTLFTIGDVRNIDQVRKFFLMRDLDLVVLFEDLPFISQDLFSLNPDYGEQGGKQSESRIPGQYKKEGVQNITVYHSLTELHGQNVVDLRIDEKHFSPGRQQNGREREQGKADGPVYGEAEGSPEEQDRVGGHEDYDAAQVFLVQGWERDGAKSAEVSEDGDDDGAEQKVCGQTKEILSFFHHFHCD